MHTYRNLLLTLAILLIIGAGCVATTDTQKRNTPPSVFSFQESEFDFGVIKQSNGKVKHTFPFTYNGTEPITISGVPTSCACTSAVVDKTELQQGDIGILTVTFNPNLHAEPDGKFFKTANILTDPALEEIPEVKIWVEIDLDLGKNAFELQSDYDDEDGHEKEILSYTSITPHVLSTMLKEKDFTLIDVHIPEQDHIADTDLFIPYTSIATDQRLPKDKNAKIVLYCRTGGMSRAAAYTLNELGYTNVYDVSGGKDAYDAFVAEQKKKQVLGAKETKGFIEFDVRVMTEDNRITLAQEFGEELHSVLLDLDKTNILIALSNHRMDLSDFAYQSLATLDRIKADSWNLVSDAVGGHHIMGVLTFPKIPSPPKMLTISGLPVEDVSLTFKEL